MYIIKEKYKVKIGENTSSNKTPKTMTPKLGTT